jgi:hypothetical protein
MGKQVEGLKHHAHFRPDLVDVGLLGQDIVPSIKICPLVACSRRLRHLKKVLLPEPEGPITTTTSPASMLAVTSTRAGISWGA